MGLRRTKINPGFRLLAAGALFMFVAAQVLCFAHCSLGESRGEVTQGCCQAKPVPLCDGDSSSTPATQDPMPLSTCSTLMNAVWDSASAKVVIPELPLLYVATLNILAPTAPEPDLIYSREPWPAGWVFTPEVSLGPAHRSLAPPLLG
jgi:hypothetical protein